MKVRENEKKRDHIRFNGHDIALVATMLDRLNSTIDIMYFLMERKEERAFVIMLISAEDIDMEALIGKEKRETDIMFEIDAGENLYAIVCQDTQIDGGYHFAERLVQKMMEKGGKHVYCSELEVRSTTYKIRYIIYRLMELFIQTKQNSQENEVVFKALN
ncbi:hypothetical protein [Sulfurovum sp.]|uniref:hypothetical protein n=1 Tax=Sulfurovum sp. TaxID=1969726 RepID=UPI0025EE94BD|nr:hypothetical protein [Sulfurovum sp.]